MLLVTQRLSLHQVPLAKTIKMSMEDDLLAGDEARPSLHGIAKEQFEKCFNQFPPTLAVMSSLRAFDLKLLAGDDARFSLHGIQEESCC